MGGSATGVLITDKSCGARSPRLLCGIKPGAQSTMQLDGERDSAVKKSYSGRAAK